MNDAAYVLGIDIGTTGARVGIFDLKGNPIVFCSENFPLYTPASGRAEQDANDCLIIHAPALCTDTLVTNDIVRFTGDNKFQIIGRRDNTVCSGGIKIQIEEVEHWLHSLGIDNVVVTYRTDARLGQALVYLCTDSLDIDSLTPPAHISTARYWLPRHVVHVPQLPFTANGKPDRALAHKIAENYL